MGIEEHERLKPEKVSFGIVVVSDKVYRGEREDVSGRTAERLITEVGHEIRAFKIIPNSEEAILSTLDELLDIVDVILFVGGTGVGPNDITVDVVSKISNKYVPGFGELFRYETYKKHGPFAILSRAGMWVYKKVVVAVTPGSPDAVETALKLILPVAPHLVMEAKGLRHGMRKGV